jgi:hypothetical protein
MREGENMVPVKIIEYNKIGSAKQEIYGTVHQHQVEISSSIAPGI